VNVQIHVITAFPHTFDGFVNASILKRAVSKGAVTITLHHLRDYAMDRHQQIDDYPFGGGP
jgi:tRNA (guanine37-N1)-methyltransferase